MYKMFIEFGFKPQNIHVLGKAYSSNAGVIEDLKTLGLNVSQPRFSGISFDIEHANNCIEVIKAISDGEPDHRAHHIREDKSIY